MSVPFIEVDSEVFFVVFDLKDDSVDGESFYWKYEDLLWLKNCRRWI